MAEVERLAADGVREVTLLGQNVNSYGRDLQGRALDASPSCCARSDAFPGSGACATTSPHPKDMRDDVIAAMAGDRRALCEHVHLPAQSGSTRVLKRMRRTYSRERYLDLVRRIREGIPDVSLTTDLIVGFPGETDEDFAETLSLVREVQL